MTYIVKPSADGDKYEFFIGSTPIGNITPLSNNEALLKMVGKGKVVSNLPNDFFEKVSKGTILEDDVDAMIAGGYTPCDCEICPKPVTLCEYKKI